MSMLRSVVFAVLCVLSGAALAQSYPARPVKIIVGFAPGSATDIIMRLVADQFSIEKWTRVAKDSGARLD